MSISHFKISQSYLIAALTFIVGQVAAYVPAFGPDKQIVISAGSAGIAAVFMIANSIHALVASKVSAADLEGGVRSFVHDELSKVDFQAIVSDVESKGVAGVPELVAAEVNKAFANFAALAARGIPSGSTLVAPAPVPPADSIPTAPVPSPGQ